MTRRVLFLCTGNSARSVLAEATLRAWAGNRYEVFSAGSQPAGQVNPYAIAQLAADGLPTTGLRSKSWDEFCGPDCAPMDLIVTVCDAAAAESCPVVFGDFVRTHWGLPDPAAVEGSDDTKRAAFEQAHRIVKARLLAFLAISPDAWNDRAALQDALDAVGFVQPEEQANA